MYWVQAMVTLVKIKCLQANLVCHPGVDDGREGNPIADEDARSRHHPARPVNRRPKMFVPSKGVLEYMEVPLGHASACGSRCGDEGIEVDICEEGRKVCSHTRFGEILIG
jgi:hypothetical protein